MMNRIRELREAKGMTQVRLSIELEVTQETVSAYETGKHYASLKSMMKMAELFDTTMDYIMGLTNVKKSIQTSDLDSQETDLICAFRKLGYVQKEKAISYIQGLSSQ